MARATERTIHLVANIEGHTDRAWSVSWHPNLPILATCSGDKSVRLAKFSLHPSYPDSIQFPNKASTALPLSHTRTVRSLAWSPNGAMLASASFDSTVAIWERVSEDGLDDGDHSARQAANLTLTDDWECVSSIEGHESEVKSVAWSDDGNLLSTCGRDKSVWIWECSDPSGNAEFDCVAVLMDHTQDVKQVAWHPSSQILASASYDDTIRIYQPDLATDDWSSTHVLPPPPDTHRLSTIHNHNPPELPTFARTGHHSTVWSCCFSPDGSYLASCSEDATIRIWQRIILTNDQLPDVNKVFRIGASEKERWDCVAVVSNQFERSVYSIDWGPPLGNSKDTASLGSLVAAGGDGKIIVLDVRIRASESTHDQLVDCMPLASIEEAHGVSDVNGVQWCRFKPQSMHLKNDLDSDGIEDVDDSDRRPPSRIDSVQTQRWAQATLGVFASAGDDGLVKVWRVV